MLRLHLFQPGGGSQRLPGEPDLGYQQMENRCGPLRPAGFRPRDSSSRRLAERPRRRLDLPPWRLPGPQEWLSYRARLILNRAFDSTEVQHFPDTTRRIAALLLLAAAVHR